MHFGSAHKIENLNRGINSCLPFQRGIPFQEVRCLLQQQCREFDGLFPSQDMPNPPKEVCAPLTSFKLSSIDNQHSNYINVLQTFKVRSQGSRLISVAEVGYRYISVPKCRLCHSTPRKRVANCDALSLKINQQEAIAVTIYKSFLAHSPAPSFSREKEPGLSQTHTVIFIVV